jgi:hypothetical protein
VKGPGLQAVLEACAGDDKGRQSIPDNAFKESDLRWQLDVGVMW